VKTCEDKDRQRVVSHAGWILNGIKSSRSVLGQAFFGPAFWSQRNRSCTSSTACGAAVETRKNPKPNSAPPKEPQLHKKMRVHFRCRGVGKGQKVVQKTLKAVPVLSPKYHSIEFQSVCARIACQGVGWLYQNIPAVWVWHKKQPVCGSDGTPCFYHVLSLSQTHARLAYRSSVLYGSLWEPAQSCRKLGKSICLRLSFQKFGWKKMTMFLDGFWVHDKDHFWSCPKATSSLQVLDMHLAYGFCPRWGHGDLVPRQKSGTNRDILPLILSTMIYMMIW